MGIRSSFVETKPQTQPATNWLGFCYMLVTRSNPLGGHPLTAGSFPLSEDKQGNFGIKLGYHDRCGFCGKGGGEPILLKIQDAERFAVHFGIAINEYKKLFKQPRVPFRVRFARYLLGEREYRKIQNEQAVIQDD